VTLDPEAMISAAREFNFYRGSWLKRKSLCVEAVDTLAEGMEKKRTEVEQLVGVDTDEDAGEAMPGQLKL
jgi:hypothetical protein